MYNVTVEQKEKVKPKRAKPGPKPIVINWEEFDKLCMLQCSLNEIASWFDCSIDTIENKVKATHGMRFSDYFALKRGKGKVALRRKQYEAAMAGNTTLLIWLGKQYLSQVDKIETDQKIESTTTVIHKSAWATDDLDKDA